MKNFIVRQSQKYGLNLSVKNAKKLSSLKILQQWFEKKIQVLAPCILHLRNFNDLKRIIRNKVGEDAEKAFQIFTQEFLNNCREKIKELPENYFPILLIFSFSKENSADLQPNNFIYFFDFYFDIGAMTIDEKQKMFPLIIKNFFSQQWNSKEIIEELMRY